MYFYCSVIKNVELLKKLLHYNFKYNKYVSYGAAYNGDLEMLKWGIFFGYTCIRKKSPEKMVVIGIIVHVVMQLKMDI